MARDRLVLGLVVSAALGAACAAPTIDTIDDEIVLPKRATDGSRSDTSADDTPAPSSSSDTGTAKSADTNGADASTGTPPPPPPPPVGKWMQANGLECGAFCASQGKANVASVEGAKCTSGENIPASAIAGGITYSSCYPSCNAHLADNGSPVSVDKYCYSTGQKRDNDGTDVTRGCFCK